MRSCHCTLAGTEACKTCPNNYEVIATKPITDGYVYIDPKDYGKEAVEAYKAELVKRVEEYFKLTWLNSLITPQEAQTILKKGVLKIIDDEVLQNTNNVTENTESVTEDSPKGE